MKHRRATQAERSREFSRLGNAEDLDALVRNLMPVDAKFMAEAAKRMAVKSLLDKAWRKHKRGKL